MPQIAILPSGNAWLASLLLTIVHDDADDV